MTKDHSLMFGRRATDVITGFDGIITGHASYMAGESQYLVSPRVQGGVFREPQWIDVRRLQIDADEAPISLDQNAI